MENPKSVRRVISVSRLTIQIHARSSASASNQSERCDKFPLSSSEWFFPTSCWGKQGQTGLPAVDRAKKKREGDTSRIPRRLRPSLCNRRSRQGYALIALARRVTESMSLKDNPGIHITRKRLENFCQHSAKDIFPIVPYTLKCSDDILKGRHACNVQQTGRPAAPLAKK